MPPDGQITRASGDSAVESFFDIEAKFFCSSRRANQNYNWRRPGPKEGRIMIVTYAGWDAVDAAASGAIVVAGRVLWTRERRDGALGDGAEAYGEIVWSWHPLLVLNRRRFSRGPTGSCKTANPQMTVAKGIRRRGERAISRKTIAQGMPDCLR